MPDLTVQIKADLTNYIAGMKQAGSISASAASDITKQLSQVSQAQTAMGGTALSASMRFQQMRSGMSAARDGMIGLTMSGQRADSALMAMGHHFTSLVNETGSLGGAFKALGQSLLGIGGVILALTVAMEIYKKLQKDTKKDTEDYVSTLNFVRQAQLKGQQDGADEIVRLGILYNATQNHKLSIQQRNAAYDELDAKYPKFFSNADREKTLLGQNKIAYDNLAASILAAANAKAYEAQIGKNSNRAFEDQQKINDELVVYNKLYADKLKNDRVNDQISKAGGRINPITTTLNNVALDASKKRLADLYADQTKLYNQTQDLIKMASDAELAANFKTETEIDKKSKKIKEQKTTLQQLEDQYKKLQDAEAKWIEAGNVADPWNLTALEHNLLMVKATIDDIKERTSKGLLPTPLPNETLTSIQNIQSDDMPKRADPGFDKAMSDLRAYHNLMSTGHAQADQFKKDTQQETQYLKEFSQVLGGGLTNAFQQVLSGTQTFMQSFGQFIVQLIERLVAAIAAAAILATLLAVITGGSIVIAFAGGFGGTATNSFGSLLSSGTGLHLADGGITNGPTRALIGEGREREAVMPLSKLQNFVNTNSNNSGPKLVGILTGPTLQLWDVRSKIQKGRIG